jgi:anti-anti-sigma factor
LVREEGSTRLVVNFAGVSYLCSEVLGTIAALTGEVEPHAGHIALCGLDPLLREKLRITRLDSVFEVCNDEAEALGLIVR